MIISGYKFEVSVVQFQSYNLNPVTYSTHFSNY